MPRILYNARFYDELQTNRNMHNPQNKNSEAFGNGKTENISKIHGTLRHFGAFK